MRTREAKVSRHTRAKLFIVALLNESLRRERFISSILFRDGSFANNVVSAGGAESEIYLKFIQKLFLRADRTARPTRVFVFKHNKLSRARARTHAQRADSDENLVSNRRRSMA